jgi:type IV secretory pathway TraG/TraD family ATPase VirD4
VGEVTSTSSRSSGSQAADGWTLALAGIVALIVVVCGVWLAALAAAALGGTSVSHNPFGYLIALAAGKAAWPAHATLLLIIETVIVAVLAGAGTFVWLRARRRRARPDRAAGSLASRADLAHLGPKQAAVTAARLRAGGVTADPAGHGVAIGRAVPAGDMLRASWEDTLLLLAGPRTGKSTCWVIPAVVDAPGPVLVTSNKRDVYDATAAVRRTGDDRHVFNFDPQAVASPADAEPAFWFNPLAGVASITDAKTLASHFVAGARSATARTDAYFDTEGERLLAGMLLAAARAGASLLDAYGWLADPYDPTPAEALTQAGDALVAARMRAIQRAPDKQRDGVYGTALSLTGCLEDPAVARWVTPPAAGNRPAFDPAAFATSHDTLYSHSREGEGSAGPLVAALTQAVLDAATAAAAGMPAGRLDPPLLSVLDEAANVCRLRHLPENYSHFGSRGLPVLTVLQSFEQGVDVWGRSGMKKLFDTANVRIYAGGVADADFLDTLSRLVGEHERRTVSVSVDGKGARSRNYQNRPERIYDAAALASLPRGRALVLASGTPPTLVAPTPWMTGGHAAAITASIAEPDPSARRDGGTAQPAPVEAAGG